MRLIRVLLLCFMPVVAYAGEIELEGTYQGENLYVNNPYAATGVGFCVYEVMVNGTTTTDEINSNSFEVDFSVFRFAMGDPVNVTIRYKEGCEPSVINPEVIAPSASFKTVDIAVNNNAVEWETTNETGSLPFKVEQYRWNKWIQVAEVQGEGVPGTHHYEVPVRLHSGENRFRIRQTDDQNKRKTSPEAIFIADKPEVSLKSQEVEDALEFSDPTLYEIYDIHGRIVFKGYSDSVNVEGLEEGEYFLNYGNRMSEFVKE